MFGFLVGIAFCGSAALAQPKGDVARGAAKAAACAGCHGTAERAPPAGMPWLSGQPELYLVLQMILFREGLRETPEMTPFMKSLSDQDIADIAAHFARQALAASDAERDPGLFARGAALAKAMNCGSCHRADYGGQRNLPRLANQREDYLIESMKAYRDNRRAGTDTAMNGVLYRVSDTELQALAHYLAQQ